MVGQEEEIIYFILLILRYKQVFVFHKRYKLFCCNREDRTRQRGKQKKKNGKKKSITEKLMKKNKKIKIELEEKHY